jgi:GntR family transcriptional repressor for pyruvate dehydrogenase complex
MMQTANTTGKGRPLLVDRVLDSLTSFIRTEGLCPGDRLPSEAELFQRMQCSRNVLREAVGRLTSLGLVEVRRGSGMFVGTADTVRSCALLLRSTMTISISDLIEFTEFRRAIEGYAARQAAINATDSELAELNALAMAIDEADISREESLQRDSAFHLRLMEIGGNRLMASILESLLDFLQASMHATTATPRDVETSRQLHAAIMDGLLRRDPAAAESAMELNRQHTIDCLNRLEETP